jgi:hypothetical protein
LGSAVVLEEKWPVLGRHERAVEWLRVWADLGRAPPTSDAYARGLAEYLLVCEREGIDPAAANGGGGDDIRVCPQHGRTLPSHGDPYLDEPESVARGAERYAVPGGKVRRPGTEDIDQRDAEVRCDYTDLTGVAANLVRDSAAAFGGGTPDPATHRLATDPVLHQSGARTASASGHGPSASAHGAGEAASVASRLRRKREARAHHAAEPVSPDFSAAGFRLGDGVCRQPQRLVPRRRRQAFAVAAVGPHRRAARATRPVPGARTSALPDGCEFFSGSTPGEFLFSSDP